MKIILNIVLLGAVLLLFWIGGFVAASYLLQPDFEPVDLDDPPVDLAVLGLWEDADGELACRAFYYRNLSRHSASLPSLRFAVSNEEFELCATAFSEFRTEGRWAYSFEWDRPQFLVRLQRPDAGDPELLAVSYWSDDDRIADSRYRIDPVSGEPTDFEFRGGFGPAQGLGSLLFGVTGGTAAWVLLLIVLVLRRVSRTKAAEGAVSAEAR